MGYLDKIGLDNLWQKTKSLIRKEVDEVEVGGRNYFREDGTGKSFHSTIDENGEYTLRDYGAEGCFSQFYNLSKPMSSFLGKEAILSFEAKSPNGRASFRIYNRNNKARYVLFKAQTYYGEATTEWQKFILPTNIVDLGESYSDSESNKIEFYAPYVRGVKLRNIKFELGNKATDWVPAPEDVSNKINNEFDKKANKELESYNDIVVKRNINTNFTISSDSLASPPFARDGWHDHFAFLSVHTVSENKTTIDGETWVDDTSDDVRRLFFQKENGESFTLFPNGSWSRIITLSSEQLMYSNVEWIEIMVSYSDPFSAFTVLIEISDDGGNTWRKAHESTIKSVPNSCYCRCSNETGKCRLMRFTFTKLSKEDAGQANIKSIKGFSNRPGDQGLGIEYEKPYNWNEYRDIFPHSDGLRSLGLPNRRWAEVNTLAVHAQFIEGGLIPFGEGYSNKYRHVWLSDANDETRRVYDNNFNYNPATNMLTTNITGTAERANGVDWSGVKNKPETYPPAEHTHEYLPLTGGETTGEIKSPSLAAKKYFYTPTMVGEGDDSVYYHRVDWGHVDKNYVDFYEYGGVWNFYQNQSGKKENSTAVASIQPDGIIGKAGWFDGIVKAKNRYLNVAELDLNTNADEIVIKTSIPFISMDAMPLISIRGYAYVKRSPIDLNIAYYIYKDQFNMCGCTTSSAWRPSVYLSTYTKDSTKYVAISLKGDEYFTRFCVDFLNIWGNARDYRAKGWTIETQYKGEGTIIPQDDLVLVPYSKVAIDITGNSANAEKVNNHTVNSDVPANAKFTDTTYSDATQTSSGLMSSTDKTKLDDIATGAEVNQPAYTYVDVDGGSGGTMGALEKEDTLNIKSGANVKVEVVTDGSGNDGHALKISATDTTYTNFRGTEGMSDGTSGLVPAPTKADFGDGVCLGSEGKWVDLGNIFPTQTWVDNNLATLNALNELKKKVEEIASAGFSVDKVYPVGSIYTSVNDTDPSTLFGGTWVRFGEGRTLVGVKSTDIDFDVSENTGGEKTHTLSANEAPRHSHYITVDEKALTGSVWNFTGQNATYGPGNSTSGVFSKGGDGTCFYPSATGKATGISDGFTLDASHTHTASSGVEGGGEAHNNMPPYITVYMWKRTK